MTYEQYLELLQQAETPERRSQLLEQAQADLETEDLERLVYIVGPANFPQETLAAVAQSTGSEQLGSMAGTVARGSGDLDDAADAAAERDRIQTIVDQLDEAGATPSEINAALDQEGVGEEGRGDFNTNLSGPRWILDSYGQLNEQQKARIVQRVGIEDGVWFDSFDDLVASGRLDQSTARTQTLVQSAVDDVPIVDAFEVDLGGGKKASISRDAFVTIQEKYNLKKEDVGYITKLAGNSGLYQNGYVPTPLVVALFKGTGILDSLQGTTRPLVGPGGETITDQRGEGLGKVLFGNVDPNSPQFEREELQPSKFDVGANVPFQTRRTLSANDLLREFSVGLERYRSDAGFAFLHTLDPILANRIALSAGDPTKLQATDLSKARSILSAAGFAGFQDFQNTLIAADVGIGEGAFGEWWNYMSAVDANAQERRGGGAGGRAAAQEPTPTFPDPAGIDETIRTLYQQMFFEEPDDATLAAFRSQINGAVKSNFDNDIGSVDIAARARQFLRSRPEYEEFYGNKPSTLSDEEYANQFQNAQASILGNELAGNEAVRSGLRSGKYQTAIGAAAGTEEAWDNSTFMGRLARAGSVVGSYT